jgi:predicted flap endonuclease-1-like 5' DNA nuclease
VAPEPAAFVNDAGPAAVMVEEGAGGVSAAETAPDDLTAIDGIGPKISGILGEDGITTFEQLAACDVDYLQQLLADAGVAASAETWPEQAAVAATGDLDALHALQARLKKNR